MMEKLASLFEFARRLGFRSPYDAYNLDNGSLHVWPAIAAVLIAGLLFVSDIGTLIGIVFVSSAAALIIAVRSRRDAVTVLTTFILLRYMLSSIYVLGALGAVGSPAIVVAAMTPVLWLVTRLLPSMASAIGRQPVRTAALTYGWAMFAGLAAAYSRPLTPLESSSTNIAIVLVCAYVGLVLLAADAIPTRQRLDTLLQRLVAVAGLLAAMGVVQYFTGFDPRTLRPPGLVPNHQLLEAQVRFVERVAATTLSSIEYGVVLASLLPIAVHYGIYGTARFRRYAWTATGIMAISIPMTVSRAAIVALVVVLTMMFANWSWRRRANGLVMVLAATVGARALLPGVLGTLRSMFLNADSDPSVLGRTGDYEVVAPLIAERPLFGRGLGTFLPSEYIILDNQYLGTLVESGAIGLAATLGLLLTGLWCARTSRRRSNDAATRSLGQALAASILAGIVTLATYDGLAFPTHAGTLFLIVGCAGALWRFEVHGAWRPWTELLVQRSRRRGPMDGSLIAG